MTTPARFGVDPALLLAAASAAGDVGAALIAARTALRSVSRHAWAADLELAAAAGRAVAVLEAAAGTAVARATALDEALRVAADSYARSDARWVR
ncbi:MAG: hypothetical protein ACLGIV_07175 [Actinomycetes bacterium]